MIWVAGNSSPLTESFTRLTVLYPLDSFAPKYRGRVRIRSNNFVSSWGCYLSKTLNKDGSISLTSSRDDALEVEFGPSRDEPQQLFIPNVEYCSLLSTSLTLTVFHLKTEPNTGIQYDRNTIAVKTSGISS